MLDILRSMRHALYINGIPIDNMLDRYMPYDNICYSMRKYIYVSAIYIYT